MEIKTVQDAIELLKLINAPLRLLMHHKLVVEAAQKLVKEIQSRFNLKFDANLVLIGAALHDCGKVVYPQEMTGSGNQHESTGEQMLLSKGISPEIARFCRTHAQWAETDITLEDLLVALADKLWKGCRDEALESKVINYITQESNLPTWKVFVEADLVFETIALEGPNRLIRSANIV